MGRAPLFRIGHGDTSGRKYASCPLCTEVVIVTLGGKVEPHPELITDGRVPRLGPMCKAGGMRLDRYVATTSKGNA